MYSCIYFNKENIYPLCIRGLVGTGNFKVNLNFKFSYPLTYIVDTINSSWLFTEYYKYINDFFVRDKKTTDRYWTIDNKILYSIEIVRYL